jgi:integrase
MGADTFEALADLYECKYVALYNRCLRTKKSRLAILKRHLVNLKVTAINSQRVTAFIAARRSEGAGNRTINRDLLVLAHLFRWALEQGHIAKNPLATIQRLEEKDWVGQRPDEHLIDKIFDKLDPRCLPLFMFIWGTGCRREEAITLKRSQIDFARTQVVFHGNTKNGRSRIVPLTDDALWAVQAMPCVSQFVFYNPTTLKPWTGDGCAIPWERARKLAECPGMRIHDLRHAYGIKLAESGECGMHFISEVLGHHSVDFTRKFYARFSPDSASRAVLKVLSKDAGRARTGTEVAQGVTK